MAWLTSSTLPQVLPAPGDCESHVRSTWNLGKSGPVLPVSEFQSRGMIVRRVEKLQMESLTRGSLFAGHWLKFATVYWRLSFSRYDQCLKLPFEYDLTGLYLYQSGVHA